MKLTELDLIYHLSTPLRSFLGKRLRVSVEVTSTLCEIPGVPHDLKVTVTFETTNFTSGHEVQDRTCEDATGSRIRGPRWTLEVVPTTRNGTQGHWTKV